jgi:hypothetical protein
MDQKSNNTMKEIKQIYESKYKQLFVLESGKIISDYKHEVNLDNKGNAHFKEVNEDCLER